MSDEFGKIYKRIWGDEDFKALPASQQLLYLKLISQPDISLAGVLTYAPIRWAMQTSDLEPDALVADFTAICRAGFVVADLDTQEVLVRSYIRQDGGWKSPKTMIGIGNAVDRILSPTLRGIISTELLRVDITGLSARVSEATGRSSRDVVESVIERLTRANPPVGYPIYSDADTPTDTPSHTPSDTPCDTPSDGVSGVGTRNCNCNSKSKGNCNCKSTSPNGEGGVLALIDDGATAPAVAVASPPKRGSRIPEDWAPARTEANLAAEAGRDPEVLNRELANFRDYWTAKAGQAATKLDWDATWRTWIRKVDNFAPKSSNQPKTGASLDHNDWARWSARLNQQGQIA